MKKSCKKKEKFRAEEVIRRTGDKLNGKAMKILWTAELIKKDEA